MRKKKQPQQRGEKGETPSPPKKIVKNEIEKCQDISNELKKLENDVLQFKGTKTDKQYILLEELLTRCLLKLDAIERSPHSTSTCVDPSIFIATRKSLIVHTQDLLKKLENSTQTETISKVIDNESMQICNNISKQLDNINSNVKKFNGKRDDKTYLELDESLTKCLIDLDNVKSEDHLVIGTRKSLIDYAQQTTKDLENRI
jgi:hypothetical protein